MKILVSMLIYVSVVAADPIYTVADAGSLGSSSIGYAVNGSGMVAGSSQNASGYQQAFTSTANGAKGLSSPTSDSYAYGINNAGIAVGTTYTDGQAYGTIWNNSTVTELCAGSYAMAINNAGEIVGGDGQAFIYANGQIQNLASPAAIGWSAAYGVNDSGTVVGDGQLSDGSFRGMIWNADGSVVELGTLGGRSSQATGVNDSGEVVGFASVASGYQHAFAVLNGAMIDLGTLGGGSSFAYGINNSGEIVGYSYLANGNQDAFLYYNGSMLDLNSLIPSNSGWELQAAYGINDSGQITGEGLYDGQETAFLLTDPPAGGPQLMATPEPPAFATGAAALLLIIVLRASRYSRSRCDLGGWGATGNRGTPSGRV